MTPTVVPWVEEAVRLPVAFAQVREDAWLDGWVIEQLPAAAAVMMVASGGCTAAYLATLPKVARLHLVDANPAQIALTRLKLHLVKEATPEERLALLGHAPLPAEIRQARLLTYLQFLDIPPTALGPVNLWSAIGPDQAGRYERVFAQLRTALADQKTELDSLMRLRVPAEQAARVAPGTELCRALDRAFDEVMALPNLVQLFGEGATRNRVEPFARHFARRTRHALATLPAADNPYLGSILLGRFPDGVATPWLTVASPTHWPHVSCAGSVMTEALGNVRAEFDFVHLSNILDWLRPDEARATLELTRAALRPGGWTLIRQLNSTLDIPSLDAGFVWHDEQARSLHAADRSYFYRGLHLGRKR